MIRIRIKLNVITRPAHTYAHRKYYTEEKQQAHKTSEKSPHKLENGELE